MALAIIVLACGPAAAQQRATPPAPPPRAPHPPAGIGGDLALGWAGERNGSEGYVVRFEYEVWPVFAPRDTTGAVFGFLPGIEYWRSGDDNWGFSMPLGIVLGLRTPVARVTAGLGFDAFLVDQVDDDTGFGLWAPFGMARVGADVLGVQLGVDARLGYRWQFGADDHARWQLGVFAGYTWEAPTREPRDGS